MKDYPHKLILDLNYSRGRQVVDATNLRVAELSSRGALLEEDAPIESYQAASDQEQVTTLLPSRTLAMPGSKDKISRNTGREVIAVAKGKDAVMQAKPGSAMEELNVSVLLRQPQVLSRWES